MLLIKDRVQEGGFFYNTVDFFEHSALDRSASFHGAQRDTELKARERIVTRTHLTLPLLEHVAGYISDQAGSWADPLSRAPVVGLRRLFSKHGITCLTDRDLRGPLGIDKRLHLQQLCQRQDVLAQWKTGRHGLLDDARITRMYEEELRGLIMAAIPEHMSPVPGRPDLNSYLTRSGVPIGRNTGYDNDMANTVLTAERDRREVSPLLVSVSDVGPGRGRPHPDMIYLVMEELGISRELASCVVTVDDTVVGAAAGKAAGTIHIGIEATIIGLSPAQWAKLSNAEKLAQRRIASRKLKEAGAKATLLDLTSMPELLHEVDKELGRMKKELAA